MNFNNLVEPIVSSYLYTSVYNSHGDDGDNGKDGDNEPAKKISGGCPVSKIYKIYHPDKMGGGGLGRELDDYAVPIGLVYIPTTTSSCGNGRGSSYAHDEFENKPSLPNLVGAISTPLYDTLVSSVAYSVVSPSTQKKTAKKKPSSTTPTTTTTSPIQRPTSKKTAKKKSGASK